MADTTTDKLWTPSNVITITRICLVPLFVIVLITPWPNSVPDSTSSPKVRRACWPQLY